MGLLTPLSNAGLHPHPEKVLSSLKTTLHGSNALKPLVLLLCGLLLFSFSQGRFYSQFYIIALIKYQHISTDS